MTLAQKQAVHVIGGGLAGAEASWQLAAAGVPVCLHEMRPVRSTEAHKTDGLAELVCSNSLRSDDCENNAVGLLHEEMRRLNSLVMRAADGNQVPAGGALAVDRDGFSAAITAALTAHPLIEIVREEVALPPPEWDSVIVATGPLDLAGAGRDHRHADRRGCARVLRRHCADRASRLHRHGRGVVPVALRQGRSRRLRRRLHQLPDGSRAVRGFRRGAAGRRQDLVPGLGEDHALFRRLPADRGDGGARRGNACATAR